MNTYIKMRATGEDMILLKKEARLRGTNVSALLRQLMIQHGYIKP